MLDEELLEGPIRPIQFDATYVKSTVPSYRGHPLIEALGNPPPPEKFPKLFSHTPKSPKLSERRGDIWARLVAVDKLKNVILPLDEYKFGATALWMILRNAYEPRNPLRDEDERRLVAIANATTLEELKLPAGWKSGGQGHLVISSTGTGKTTFIDAFLLRLCQVIRHTEYDGRPLRRIQVVWIKISIPPDGSLKALCLTFFAEVDRLLGSNYLRQAYGLETVPKMTMLMGRVATAISLGMLVIDELQNLKITQTANAVFVLNLLVELIERIGISVVTVATPVINKILQDKTRDTRKLVDGGTTYFPIMSASSSEWDYFCEMMWEYIYTNPNAQGPLTPEIKDAWHEASGGNSAFAALAFRRAQHYAILEGDVGVDITQFELVLNRDLAALKPAIDALVGGDEGKILEFEDLLFSGSEKQKALADMLVPHRINIGGLAHTPSRPEAGDNTHGTGNEDDQSSSDDDAEFDDVQAAEDALAAKEQEREAKRQAKAEAKAKAAAAKKATKNREAAAPTMQGEGAEEPEASSEAAIHSDDPAEDCTASATQSESTSNDAADGTEADRPEAPHRKSINNRVQADLPRRSIDKDL